MKMKIYLPLFQLFLSVFLIAYCASCTDSSTNNSADEDFLSEQDVDAPQEADSNPDIDEIQETDLDSDLDDSDTEEELDLPMYVEPTPGFAVLPKGSYWMGSPEGEPGDSVDAVPHYVNLTWNFEIMPFETSQRQWRDIAEHEGWPSTPSHQDDCGDSCPVEQVNWFEALAFANALSRQAGLEECYKLENCLGTIGEGCTDGTSDCFGDFSCEVSLNGVESPYLCAGYRLPTESEWEFAARAGSDTTFYNGGITVTDAYACTPEDPNLTEIAWYCANANGKVKPSGLKLPNAWGLYDTLGNVWEWTWDWYTFVYPAGDENDPAVNPVGPSQSPRDSRVYRGGTYSDDALHLRVAKRDYLPPKTRSARLGFRIVRSLGVGDVDLIIPEHETEYEGDQDTLDIYEDDYDEDVFEAVEDWERPETGLGIPWLWCPDESWAIDGNGTGQLTISDSALYCGTFNEMRSLQDEIEAKSQLSFAPGSYALPTENGTFSYLLPFCLKFTEDGTQPTIHEPGSLQTSHDEQYYRYFFQQPLVAENGDEWSLSLELSAPHNDAQPYLTLDGSYCGLDCSFSSRMTLCRGDCIGANDRRTFDSCHLDTLDPETHYITFDGGWTRLEVRIGYSLASTEPGLFSHAEGHLDGQDFEQNNYWKLIYNPEHHHFVRDFQVLFDTPIGEVCGLKAQNLDIFLQDPFGRVTTTDCANEEMEERTIYSEQLEGNEK